MTTNRDITQDRTRHVLEGFLLAMARIMLRAGVTYVEFSDLAKRAFVQAATEEYGVRNRPTNTSRVALITGLSRKEVTRLRRLASSRTAPKPVVVTLPAAVLNAWHTTSKFVDRDGNPRVLAFEGAGSTFSSLVRSITRDVPPGAMRQELLRVGAVQRVDRDGLLPKRRFFVPDSADEKIVIGLELGLRRLAETVEYNSSSGRAAPKFQRFVEGRAISTAMLPKVREGLEKLLGRFSMEVDDYLSKVSASTRNRRGKLAEAVGVAGVGLYYFDSFRQPRNNPEAIE